MLTLRVRPSQVGYALALFALALALISLTGQYIVLSLGEQAPRRWMRAFNVDSEWNLPTWYSSVALLLTAGLFAVCAAAARRQSTEYVAYWRALSLIFLLLSLDEFGGFHEGIRSAMFATLLPEAIARSWLPFGLALVVIVGLIYLRFLLALPRRTALLFTGAGALYLIVGALGMEAVSWFLGYHTVQATRDLTYNLLATGEELAEMLGVALLIYAILDHLARTDPNLRLALGQDEVRPVGRQGLDA
jgi:hypothetical protein